MCHPYLVRETPEQIGAQMNMDQILICMLVIGGIVGFFYGYYKGHEHGKIAGRIALRREQYTAEQVGR